VSRADVAALLTFFLLPATYSLLLSAMDRSKIGFPALKLINSMGKCFFKLFVGMVMLVVQIARLRRAICTTNITIPTTASAGGASSHTTLAQRVS